MKCIMMNKVFIMEKSMFFIFFCLFVLSACGGAGDRADSNQISTLAPVPAEYAGKTNPLGADAEAEGAKIFHTNCEVCHGVEGHGDGPAGQSLDPRPKNLAQLQTVASDDYFFWRINDGKPGTSMVAWKGVLSDEQIWQVISFIRTLK